MSEAIKKLKYTYIGFKSMTLINSIVPLIFIYSIKISLIYNIIL